MMASLVPVVTATRPATMSINAYHSIICYNCEELGHLASDCPREVLCNICKQPDHLAITCPFSWVCQVDHRDDPENLPENPPENVPDLSHEEEVSREGLSDEQLVNSDSAVSPGKQSIDQSSPEEYLSASEDSPPSTTLELFPNKASDVMPPPCPQRPRSTSRRSTNVQLTIIPLRTPTQPVLVTGKS